MPEEMEFQRRLPSVFRRISDIGAEDIRVCIVGRVIDAQEGIIVIDDGTGKINASVEGPAEVGSAVRVFGRVIHMENGHEIQGEIVQNLGGIDLDIYRKTEKEWSRGL